MKIAVILMLLAATPALANPNQFTGRYTVDHANCDNALSHADRVYVSFGKSNGHGGPETLIFTAYADDVSGIYVLLGSGSRPTQSWNTVITKNVLVSTKTIARPSIGHENTEVTTLTNDDQTLTIEQVSQENGKPATMTSCRLVRKVIVK